MLVYIIYITLDELYIIFYNLRMSWKIQISIISTVQSEYTILSFNYN